MNVTRIVAASLLLLAFGGWTARAGEPKAPASMPAIRQHAHAFADLLGGRVYAVGNTPSMVPLLGRGDLVVAVPYDFDSVRVGDLVVFVATRIDDQRRRQKSKVLHRVVEIRPCVTGLLNRTVVEGCTRLRTQGDALGDRDPGGVDRASFVGRVVYAINGRTGDERDLHALLARAPLRGMAGFLQARAERAARGQARRSPPPEDQRTVIAGDVRM